MNLNKRLEKIERLFNKSIDSVTAIFLTALGADNGKPDHKPLLGWKFEFKGQVEIVIRRDDESEEELCERASSYAFEVTSGQVTILTAIDETDIHALGVKSWPR